jgi:hypothetical protein
MTNFQFQSIILNGIQRKHIFRIFCFKPKRFLRKKISIEFSFGAVIYLKQSFLTLLREVLVSIS